MTQESEDCSEGLVAYTFYILQKKPTQYKAAIQEINSLLEKVKAKIEKTKAVRVDKKTKIKEKMQVGEYLPKDVYEEQRKAKKEKLLADRAEREAKKALEMKERKEKRAKEGKDEDDEEDGSRKKEFKRGDKGDKPFKKEFKKDFKKDGGDAKGKWGKDSAPGKFDKGKFGKDGAPGKFDKGKKFPAYEDKRAANDKIKQFKKDQAQDSQPSVKLHPSWEAKKEQIDRDTHIKFVQNPVFEF